jgi:hypothetical protein
MSEAAAPLMQPDRVRVLLRVAWLAILLGISVQLLVFAVRLCAGLDMAAAAVLADLRKASAGRSWSASASRSASRRNARAL